MAIKQLSVFIANQKGSLVETVKSLADHGINIRAMSIADTKDFGILRFIVSETEQAKAILKSNHAIVTETEVIAVKMEDRAGVLCNVLMALKEADINLDYVYAFTASKKFGAYVVLRVDDNKHAETVLKNHGFQMLEENEINEI